MRHRLVHNVEDAEKYQEREKHSAAAAHGVVALLLELCHLLLLLLLVVFVFLLNLAHLGRKYRRLRGVLLLLYRKRQHGELYNKGKQKYRNADVAAYELVDKVQDIAQRLTYKAVKEIYSVHVLSKRKGQAGARPAQRMFIEAAKRRIIFANQQSRRHSTTAAPRHTFRGATKTARVQGRTRPR